MLECYLINWKYVDTSISTHVGNKWTHADKKEHVLKKKHNIAQHENKMTLNLPPK